MLQTAEPEVLESPPALTGTRLGSYQIIRLLGRGGMGAVFEAVHVVIGRRVAIKTLNRSCGAVPGVIGQFLREAQITSALRHPHIVDLTDMGVEDGVCYLVMEYLEGEDLNERLKRGSLSVEETVEIALPVIAAVGAAHEQGIIHRDLKPHNIFLSRGAGGAVHPKVLDFGISKRLGAPASISLSSTAPGGLLGSPCYLAPEQLEQSRGASPASDQYALGVLVYECLTGRTPFAGPELAVVFQNILSGALTPLSALRPDLPSGLQQIVARAMSLRSEDRFPSANELGRALMAYAAPRTRLNWEETFGDGAPTPSSVTSAASPVEAPASTAQPAVAAPPVLHALSPGPSFPSARSLPDLPSRAAVIARNVAYAARARRRVRKPSHWSPWVGLAIAFATAFSTMIVGTTLLPDPKPHRSPASVEQRVR